MKLPARLTLTGTAYALDGGTISLLAADENGLQHTVVLVQRSRPEQSRSFAAVPGRLYFDRELVPIRSEFEAGVLSLLKSADVRFVPAPRQGEQIQLSPNALVLGDDIRQVLTRGPEENIRALTTQVIEFVSSDDYLLFAERVEQAADDTLYDVWVAWDSETFNKAVVKTKQVLGLTMKEARELVEQERAVARGAKAPEVVEWAKRYREAGLGVRVSPEFRWRLPSPAGAGG